MVSSGTINSSLQNSLLSWFSWCCLLLFPFVHLCPCLLSCLLYLFMCIFLLLYLHTCFWGLCLWRCSLFILAGLSCSHSWINYHWYTSALWIKCPPFSRAARALRQPHAGAPISLPSFTQHLREWCYLPWNVRVCNVEAVFTSLTASVQGVHSDYSNSFRILSSIFSLLPSSLPLPLTYSVYL